MTAAVTMTAEAGGAVTDLAGAPLRYNEPAPSFPSVVVSADLALHRALLAALQRRPAAR